MFIGRFEISQNLEYLITLPGFGKILTLVLGGIALGLGGYSYEGDLQLWKEDVYLDSVSFFEVISFVYLVAHCLIYDLVIHKLNRMLDICFHVAGAGTLMIVGCFMIVSAVNVEETKCTTSHLYYCEYFDEKLGAGVFAILDSILYATTAFLIFKNKSL